MLRSNEKVPPKWSRPELFEIANRMKRSPPPAPAGQLAQSQFPIWLPIVPGAGVPVASASGGHQLIAVPAPEAVQPGPGQAARAPPPSAKVAPFWTDMKLLVRFATAGNAGKLRSCTPEKFILLAPRVTCRPT
jgi:hypothetical protein